MFTKDRMGRSGLRLSAKILLVNTQGVCPTGILEPKPIEETCRDHPSRGE